MTQFNIQKSPDTKKELAALRDQLLKATPTQIENYIENNITDLASAKEVMKKMAVVLALLARRVVKQQQ